MRSAVLLTLLALAPGRALARAGGGDSFSGGSSRSFGSSSWSSSSSSSSRSSYRRRCRGSRGSADVNVLLALIVLVIILHLLKNAGSTMPSGPAAPPAVMDVDWAGPLKARDHAFDAEAFLRRCGAAVVKVQEAWSAGDLRPARHLLSDGVYERFRLLLDLQRRQGLANRVSNVRVLRAQVAHLATGELMDALHVHMTVSCVDQYFSAASGERVRGTGRPETFSEVWSFLRAGTARSRPQGLLEGLCPSCGAPLSLTQATACRACGAWVNSGEHDWVLSEITQTSEWRRPSDLPAMFLRLLAKDPGLCAQALEDRASAAFWRYQKSLADRDIRPLAAMADGTAQGELRAPGLGQLFYADCAVGSARVVDARPGGRDDEVDVLLRWSGRPLPLAALSEPSRGPSPVEGPWDMIATLSRRSGAATRRWTGLRASHCPSCGAAVEALERFQCAYCGKTLADAAEDWVLAGIRV